MEGQFLVDDGCWLWTGPINADGYGVIRRKPFRGTLAHRAMYELMVGPIPTSLPVIDHVKANGCTHRNCVRPDHLEPVTLLENIRRGMAGKLNHRNAGKTHCIRGHSLEDAYVRPGGGRYCRQCRRVGS